MTNRGVTLGWSNFAREHSRRGTGHSYSRLSEERVVELALDNWASRKPGDGEMTLERKVLVRVPPDGFYCPPRARPVEGMPVQAEIVTRQEEEDPYVEVFVSEMVAREHDALVERPARTVDIVCYSADALTENDGERSTDCDWEIVTILCTDEEEQEPMTPLTMARNFLEKAGGTKSVYTARELAESIWHHATQRGISVKD
jgi:hypothetical protein